MESVTEIVPFIDALHDIADNTKLLGRMNNVDPNGPNASAAVQAYNHLVFTGFKAEILMKEAYTFCDRTMHVMQGIVAKGNDISQANLEGIQDKAIN